MSTGNSSGQEGQSSPMQNSITRSTLYIPLSILIKITQVNGEVLPPGILTEQLVTEMFENAVGVVPDGIELVNNQDIFVELPEETSTYDMAQAIQGEGRWRDLDICVHCIVATKESCMSIQKEREEARISQENLLKARMELEDECQAVNRKVQESRKTINKETSRVQSEFLEYKMQMMELTRRVNEQLLLLETIRSNAERQFGAHPSPTYQPVRDRDVQINKPPNFPSFSGMDPTPKDECGIETLLFQVKGARENVTDQAVRSALISCLRGGASSFIEYVGLDAPLDTMIDELMERYVKTAPTDTLVCEFHQLQQDKNESIR